MFTSVPLDPFPDWREKNNLAQENPELGCCWDTFSLCVSQSTFAVQVMVRLDWALLSLQMPVCAHLAGSQTATRIFIDQKKGALRKILHRFTN